MLQVAFAARVAPQALVPVAIAKSVGLVPPIAMLPMLSVALPVFERVEASAEDVVPTVVAGNGSDPVNEAAGAVAAAVTLNVTELEVPPPGDGLVTVTAGVPTLATSLARMAAVSCVALT